MIELKEWERWGGTFYDVHLPRVFTFRCDDPKLIRERFNWQLLLYKDGPCADGNGSHHFFGTNAEVDTALESPNGFVVYVRENRDSFGNWRDAVYEVQPTGEVDIWIARLLLVNTGHPDRNHHLRFELKSLDGKTLRVIQYIRDESGARQQREKTITLFDKDSQVRPKHWC